MIRFLVEMIFQSSESEEDIVVDVDNEEEEDLRQLDPSTWKCCICSRTFNTSWQGEDHVKAHRALPG